MAKQRESEQSESPALGQPGKVYLVGAGPGDPGLITWRSVECLRRAEAVLYDYLVNPAVLRHAPPQAKLLCLGRHRGAGEKSAREMSPGERIWTQSEINAELVQLARDGKQVIRLKGGDPIVFGS